MTRSFPVPGDRLPALATQYDGPCRDEILGLVSSSSRSRSTTWPADIKDDARTLREIYEGRAYILSRRARPKRRFVGIDRFLAVLRDLEMTGEPYLAMILPWDGEPLGDRVVPNWFLILDGDGNRLLAALTTAPVGRQRAWRFSLRSTRGSR